MVTRNDIVQYVNSNILFFRSYDPFQFYNMVRFQGQKVKIVGTYVKFFVTEDTHVKYQSLN